MNKKRKKRKQLQVPPLLPPLSAEVLKQVKNVEAYATQSIRNCQGRGSAFNMEIALRDLRTCAIQSFSQQLLYYHPLTGFCQSWLDQIRESTVKALIGLVPETCVGCWTWEEQLHLTIKQWLADTDTPKSPPTMIQNSATPESAPDTGKSLARKAFAEPRLLGLEMTRNQWAARAGINPSMVYDYLSGKSNPRPATRKLLADALGVNVLDLPK